MTDPRHHDADVDRQLSALLSDAVSDVEPANALDTLRTRTKVTPMNTRRPWLFAVGGAVVATAAVITAIALAGGSLSGTTAEDDPGPAGQTSRSADPTPSETTEPEPSDPTSTAPSDGSGGGPVPVYFVGDTPSGPRLYREFQPGTSGDPLLDSAASSVEGTALDADYRSLWPDGSSVASVTSDGADILTVDIVGAPHDLPAGLTQEEAQLALQQVIYSVQAAHGQGRVGVQLLLDGGRSDQVLGQPTSEPLANGPVLETLSHVSLTTPSEGQVVTGDELDVSGVANSFEANVVIRLQRYEGTEIVAEEPFTAEGWMGEKLFPFSGTLDVSDVLPGTYLLMAMTDDPSAGAEGNGAFTDTRLVTIE